MKPVLVRRIVINLEVMKSDMHLGGNARKGFLLIVCLFSTYGLAQNTPRETTELKAGRPLTKAMAGKNRHSFAVRLEKDVYLHLTVKQRDVDVITEVFAPDSTSIGKFDAPTSERGTERARIRANVAGSYRIDVYTVSELAGPGEYIIRVEEVRKATERDARVLTAVNLQQEAIRLRMKPETRNDAIPVYEKAVALWRELRRPEDEANTLRSIAFAYQRMERFDDAKRYFARALEIWERIGDLRSAAFTHVIYGVYSRRRNDFRAALEHDLRARKLWQKAGDKPEMVHNLVQIGDDYLNLGDRTRAFKYIQDGLDLVRSIGRKSIEAQVLNKYGDAHAKVGNKAASLAHYRQSVELWKKFNQDRIAAEVDEKIAKLSPL